MNDFEIEQWRDEMKRTYHEAKVEREQSFEEVIDAYAQLVGARQKYRDAYMRATRAGNASEELHKYGMEEPEPVKKKRAVTKKKSKQGAHKVAHNSESQNEVSLKQDDATEVQQ